MIMMLFFELISGTLDMVDDDDSSDDGFDIPDFLKNRRNL